MPSFSAQTAATKKKHSLLSTTAFPFRVVDLEPLKRLGVQERGSLFVFTVFHVLPSLGQKRMFDHYLNQYLLGIYIIG